MNFFSLITFLTTSSLCPALILSSLDPEIISTIDRIVNTEFLPINNIPALGLSVISGNGEMAKGYGYRNLEESLPATPSTLFSIASISKSFVSVLVVKTLSEKYPQLGEGALDVPIRELLPAENFTLTDRFRSESVSFRDLLSHRICTAPETLGISTDPYKDKFDYFYRQRYSIEVCPFRTGFRYSNGAFALASELVAKLAGKTFEELLTQFFRELGMDGSTYVQADVDYNTKANMSSAYYRNVTRTMRYNLELLKRTMPDTGAGFILSSPGDMLKYMNFTLRNGKIGDRQVVPAVAMSWLRKPANLLRVITWKTEESGIVHGDYAYGLGYGIGTHDGWERISHGGYVDPYVSLISFYPALNISIFSISNGPGYLDSGSNMGVLHVRILNILMGKNASVPAFKQINVPKRFLKGSKTSNASIDLPDQIVGLWGNGLSGEFTIEPLEGSTSGEMYLRFGKWGTGILHPIDANTTSYEWECDSDMAQDYFAASPDPELHPPYIFQFLAPDKIVVKFDESETIFVKNQTLDKLPVQPWDPESCVAKSDLVTRSIRN